MKAGASSTKFLFFLERQVSKLSLITKTFNHQAYMKIRVSWSNKRSSRQNSGDSRENSLSTLPRPPYKFILNLSLKLPINRIHSQGTSSFGILSHKSDIRVDVGHTLGVAGGPHGRGDVDVIFLCVGGVEGSLDSVA